MFDTYLDQPARRVCLSSHNMANGGGDARAVGSAISLGDMVQEASTCSCG
ncbi:MAG: hypothetical protein LKH76_04320 [Acetobacter fabarum]|nr:hypothetical protein [Acetobacter fabarum]MCH4026151.1 hypothetical protein [Acetobacter fabarum]MCH4054900.1 hypothetical protein [Acetobacter fabarum]MCH4085987.1 hypothetical protein [Acetobacter fabarum]MCH4127421.1 hypothetical protein [Acetobacter fabarum]MCH4136770.1 hypothetical protein [Acetobacter fabarum]